MSKPIPLLHDQYYHIYNRGIDGTHLFRERRNYPYFRQRYGHHIQPIAETFAYCLLSNHFHFLVRIRTIDEQRAYHQTEADLVAYIHRNPQKHGFVEDFREWPHSSYWSILSDKPTRIERAAVLDWFQGRVPFKEMHRHLVDEAVIEPLIAEDWM